MQRASSRATCGLSKALPGVRHHQGHVNAVATKRRDGSSLFSRATGDVCRSWYTFSAGVVVVSPSPSPSK